MKSFIYIVSLLLIVNFSPLIKADLVIKGSNAFKNNVKENLSEAKSSSIYLAELIQGVENTPATVTIKPITNDQATWHKSGVKSRSHTKALDNASRGAARNISTNSIIYINQNRITQTHKTYNSGTLIHEIVHASDLAHGKYHSSYPIREKRAVFFQNIWRDMHSKELRTDYHGRFDTNEYQKAKKTGALGQFVRHYFAHNDIP